MTTYGYLRMFVHAAVSAIIWDKDLCIFGILFFFCKIVIKKKTTFNVTAIIVYLPKVYFDVTYNFLSLVVREIEFLIFWRSNGSLNLAEGRG